jgi:hypothetical protein
MLSGTAEERRLLLTFEHDGRHRRGKTVHQLESCRLPPEINLSPLYYGRIHGRKSRRGGDSFFDDGIIHVTVCCWHPIPSTTVLQKRQRSCFYAVQIRRIPKNLNCGRPSFAEHATVESNAKICGEEQPTCVAVESPQSTISNEHQNGGLNHLIFVGNHGGGGDQRRFIQRKRKGNT